jgi:hypothetical protein
LPPKLYQSRPSTTSGRAVGATPVAATAAEPISSTAQPKPFIRNLYLSDGVVYGRISCTIVQV